ncbi:MAG TPA: NUDIX hydrolase [Terriglobales bacterium]|nr:NUDIX hydrolase [Terriglobales bacterium]
MQREYPDRPLVGVGGVILHEGRALIVQRGKPPRQGEWTVPGGMLEIGETLRSGVQREVLEETGLVVTAGEVLDVFDSIHRDPEGRTQYHYVLVDFLCTWVSGELQAASDVAQARWITREELDSMPLIGFTAQVIRKAFSLEQDNYKRH